MADIFLSIFSRFGMPILIIVTFIVCLYSLFKIPKFHSGEIQMLGISHSGIRLVKRMRKKASIDTLEVLETYSFDNIEQISPIRNGSTIDLRLSKRRITIHSHRVFHINKYIRNFSYVNMFRFKKLHN